VEKITSGKSRIVRLRLKNGQCHSITLHIEPWGEEVTMAPDRLYEVAIKGPPGETDDVIEVTTEGSDLFIYGWTGSTFTIHQDQKLLGDCQIPVPRIPPRIT